MLQRILWITALSSLAACETPAPVIDEHTRTIAALAPPQRAHPVIAVIGDNDGTETTDFIVPYAVLAKSGVAEVLAVAPEDRAIELTPSLSVSPHLTTTAFDARFPTGADYVIVPRIDQTADPAVVAWLQAQAAKGTIVVGICSGVKTVGAAGLLDERAATGHWFDIEGLRKAHPTMTWVRDRRYVVDGNVMTTTGVSASLPASLALVEAIGGRERAARVAADLGVATWDEHHDSDAFSLDPVSKRAAERNQAARPELFAFPVRGGVDDISLSFSADAWSRTFRSKAFATTASGAPVTTRYGLLLHTQAASTLPGAIELAAPSPYLAGLALPATLGAIASRYGDDTAGFVALQLEYPWAR